MSVAAFWATCKIEVTYQVFSVHVHREFVQQVEVVGAEEFGWSKRSNDAAVLEKNKSLLKKFIASISELGSRLRLETRQEY